MDVSFIEGGGQGEQRIGAFIFNERCIFPGKDFRDYTDLILWVKLNSSEPEASVKLRVDIGVFSEDLDEDGERNGRNAYDSEFNRLGARLLLQTGASLIGGMLSAWATTTDATKETIYHEENKGRY